MSESKAKKSDDLIRPLAHLGGDRPPAPEWFEKAINAPCEEASVTVEGAEIKYTAWGEEGRRGLLFVHGGRAHRNWWRPFAPFFAQNRRVAALDLSGMGDSDWRDKYSLDLLVSEVFSVIDAAGLASRGRPIVVGHSFGGWVTLAAVEREGERLGGAVVVDSPLGVPDPHEGYTVVKAKPANPDDKRTARVYATKEEPITRFRLLPNQPGEHLYLLDYIAREGLRPAPMPNGEGEGWTWKFDPGPKSTFEIHFERDLLRAARCPLAFIYGEKSMFAQGDGIAHLESQARGRSPFVTIPDAYHHLMMDQPMAFISTLRTLLSAWPVRFGV
ncbi:alpha/beta hydrolase [Hyphococcus flavus]|uniref:Alpha/beta hydrolase n=1 Tax=Hyphococcus flavus TaxID=1866326 RepID=A0AAE9ZB96_9PROT|nr:alpha/beta hydrolase [Hyphococcus flavus]WDI31449.1 alpha/beta hydrolase [Hyphococcus flavus]